MRLLDFFFALRPLVLVPAWSFFLLGYGAACRDAGVRLPFPGVRLALFSVVMACVYLVNQVVDFESDRVNGKGFFLQRGLFTRRLYLVVAGAGLIAALAWAGARAVSPVPLAAAALLGLAYSLPPLRLSAHAGLDLAANAVGYGGIAFLLGSGDAARPAAAWVLRFAAAMLAVAAVFLHTTLLDLDGDRRTGKRTAGVVLGFAVARRLAALFATLALAAAIPARSGALAAATLALAALAVAAWLRPARLTSRSLCVGSSAIFALAAGAGVLLFLPALVLLVLLTRWYYQRRFAIAYPVL